MKTEDYRCYICFLIIELLFDFWSDYVVFYLGQS